MRESLRPLLIIVLFIIFSVFNIRAQTTGKIAGIVLDKQTQEPIAGANVFIEGLSLGAASDISGDFFILNIPPGKYTLNIQMIGYSNYKINDLRISVNRTVFVTVELNSAIIEGEEIIVQAEKIASKKDQTSSIRNVSSTQIEMLPVENIEEVVNLQAGIIDGHFRGGRKNEVAFMIDGMQVVEAFAGENNLVDIETEVVEELEVITGTFNAEYGRAMSGVVNAVTKDGTDEYHAFFSSSFANYFTSHDDIFLGLDNNELNRREDFKFQISGPIWKNKLTFLFNTRLQNNDGYLNGINRFNVNDYSNFADSDPMNWYSEHNGDNKYVPLDYSILNSFTGKLTSKFLNNIKFSMLYTRNDEEWGDYDHNYKYNPYGIRINYKEADMYTFQFNHPISNTVFYDFKLSYIDNFYGLYVFKDPNDSRYVHDSYLNNNGPSFYTGGQQKDHESRTIKDYNAKFDITWQMNKQHMFKTGFLYTYHQINHKWYNIQNGYSIREEDENFGYYDYEKQKVIFPYYEPVVYPDSSIFTDAYLVKPYEFSAYVQDKMEFDKMVINLGLRYDYFNPNSTYPSQRRNPANQLDFPDNPEKVSEYINTEPQIQISPRLGLSYQLGKVAVLHFSYGHFFQMPPMFALYQNHSLLVAPTNYETTMGNSQLKAQKTVQYEVGLWQELMPGMGMEVNVYYRDIYNLLSTKMINTFNQIIYGLYTNKDYGNVKGFEVKYDFIWDNLSVYLNYTLQYTRGNADNPEQTFDRAGDSKDPIPTLIPMSWDQRHTLNLTVGYHSDLFGVTLTGYYNSGTPFTWIPFDLNPLANINLYPNNSHQKTTYSVDMNGYVKLYELNGIRLRLNFSVYNLFDRLNEYWVDSTTGRAYTAIIRPSTLSSHHSDFNEYNDVVHDPSMYNSPRLIKVGFGVSF
jgi:hypothetical protein